MRFSILIPVYNAEKYLSNCMASILPQVRPEDEIILCNDASTDGSLAICQKYAALYPDTVKVITNEKNEKQLLTRRHLFSASTGDYLFCVDADDELEENALSALSDAIQISKADMIVFNAICIHMNHTKEVFKPQLTANHLYTETDKSDVFHAVFQNAYLNPMWIKVFRRGLLDDSIDYSPWKELTIGEDLFQSYPLFDRASSIYYLDRTIYKYMKREGSMTNSGNNDLYRCRRILWPREDQYLASWNPGREALAKCYRKRCNEIINYAVNMASSLPYPAFAPEMKKILQDGFFSGAWDFARLTSRYRWYGQLLLNKRFHLLYAALKMESALTRR